MLSFLTQPQYPKAAIGIERDYVSALALEREGRGRYSLRQAATIEVPPHLITPGFLEQNISNQNEFAQILTEAVTNAGLLSQKRWSISLPSASARTAIITLESEPASRQEAEEILEWKSEQSFGAPAGELRITRQKIRPDREGRTRYFATAVRLAVIDEYETVFESMGWKAGLILPRAVSEANWLADSNANVDSLLISSQADGFTALLFRGEEPAVVRTVSCSPAERDDEIYRLLMFYNDRLAEKSNGSFLEKLLLIGKDLSPARISQITGEAFGRALNILQAEDVGLNLTGTGIQFDEVAAPAGLAALAWR
jgi:Tfp pilus assembly PilM family ATPase